MMSFVCFMIPLFKYNFDAVFKLCDANHDNKIKTQHKESQLKRNIKSPSIL